MSDKDLLLYVKLLWGLLHDSKIVNHATASLPRTEVRCRFSMLPSPLRGGGYEGFDDHAL